MSEVKIKGIEQGRAAYAYEYANEGKKYGKEYKQRVKKIPMMIKTNGLGATLAFINSKEDRTYKFIYQQMTDWFKNNSQSILSLTDDEDLLMKIISLDSIDYRAVTYEILALFGWLRRFAEGLINEGDVK